MYILSILYSFTLHIKQLREQREYLEETVTMLISLWREILTIRDRTKIVNTKASIIIKNIKQPVYTGNTSLNTTTKDKQTQLIDVSNNNTNTTLRGIKGRNNQNQFTALDSNEISGKQQCNLTKS